MSGTTCHQCEYDLSGLSEEAVCPECGLEVRTSMERRHLLGMSRADLRRAFQACVVIMIASGTLGGSVIPAIAFRSLSTIVLLPVSCLLVHAGGVLFLSRAMHQFRIGRWIVLVPVSMPLLPVAWLMGFEVFAVGIAGVVLVAHEVYVRLLRRLAPRLGPESPALRVLAFHVLGHVVCLLPIGLVIADHLPFPTFIEDYGLDRLLTLHGAIGTTLYFLGVSLTTWHFTCALRDVNRRSSR